MIPDGNKSIDFDSIVYSANLAGVVAASILKSKGLKVLLLNRYGFFGGTITESLNLYQKKIKEIAETEITRKILEDIFKFNDGILFENETHIIINPEVYKYVLQKFCEQVGIELLFHITPYRISFSDEIINLTVIGREGEIKFTCKNIFDFSTEFTLAPLINKSFRNFIKSRINFITYPFFYKELLQDVFQSVTLKDNRVWISIESKDVSLFDAEEYAQLKLDQYDSILRKHSSRIQIVPAQSNLIFTLDKNLTQDIKIKFITDYIESFQTDDEILISKEIEERIKNESNF
jgi:hypothetical protein